MNDKPCSLLFISELSNSDAKAYGGDIAVGNIIRLDKNTPVDDWVCMSNGATNAFINSGSALAETAEEKRLVVWLSEKDQKLGLGTVGFDVVEMP